MTPGLVLWSLCFALAAVGLKDALIQGPRAVVALALGGRARRKGSTEM